MVTIFMYGLDPYLLRQLSRELTKPLAKIYECSEDEINFYASDGFLVHDGVEQNTWNLYIKVEAPINFEDCESEVVDLFFDPLTHIAINYEIVFNYYSLDNRHVYINPDHPRFMTEENSVYVDDNYDDEKDLDYEEEDGKQYKAPYLGDVFGDIKKD